MADKSVISNLEARVRQLIEAHRKMAEYCAELEAQQETLRAEKRSLEVRVRELDAEVARMQLTEGLAGGSPNPGESAGPRQSPYAGGGQMHRAGRAGGGNSRGSKGQIGRRNARESGIRSR